MERRHMDQAQLAKAIGRSRSAVNSWINDRAYPLNSIGALEEFFGISLAGEEGDGQLPPEVREIVASLSPAQRERLRRFLTEALRPDEDENGPQQAGL